MAQCLPFTGIAHQNNQTLYGQNNQTVVRFTTTSEAKSDKNRRNRQNARYFPGIPGFPRYTRKIPGIIANLAEFGRKPASRLGSDPEKLMIPLSFVTYHTTLCSYHTTPQENQISGKYHSFTTAVNGKMAITGRGATRRRLPDLKTHLHQRPHLDVGVCVEGKA